MTETLTINLSTAITSVNTIDDGESSQSASPPQAVTIDRPEDKKRFESLCVALQSAAEQLKKFYQEIFTSHREQIAQLSIQIAEKILLREIEAGRYEIEKIITEALKTAPSHNDVVVRINPDDFQQYSQSSGQNSNIPDAIKLTPDPAVKPAHCIVETDKGIVEHSVEEHLTQISQALKGNN